MFVSFLFYLRPPTIRVLYAIAIALSTEYARGYFQSESTLRNAIPIVGYRPSRIVGNLSLKIQPLFKNHLSLYQWSLLHPWHGKVCLTMNSFFFCSMQVVESPSIRLFHSFFSSFSIVSSSSFVDLLFPLNENSDDSPDTSNTSITTIKSHGH